MKNIKIEVIENGVLETTVKIPLVVLKIAKHLIPKKYIARLEEKSIDINSFIEVASNPELSGMLIQIEDHSDKQIITISVE